MTDCCSLDVTIVGRWSKKLEPLVLPNGLCPGFLFPESIALGMDFEMIAREATPPGQAPRRFRISLREVISGRTLREEFATDPLISAYMEHGVLLSDQESILKQEILDSDTVFFDRVEQSTHFIIVTEELVIDLLSPHELSVELL